MISKNRYLQRLSFSPIWITSSRWQIAILRQCNVKIRETQRISFPSLFWCWRVWALDLFPDPHTHCQSSLFKTFFWEWVMHLHWSMQLLPVLQIQSFPRNLWVSWNTVYLLKSLKKKIKCFTEMNILKQKIIICTSCIIKGKQWWSGFFWTHVHHH